MNQHYFDVPFAFSGDVTAIPDPLQTGGTVSFTEGWNYNYQRDLTTDPAALPIDRSTMNWLLLQITTALQALQGETIPEFITASQNGGAAYPYGPQAEVLWSASGNAPFTKFVNITGGTNTNTPSASDVLGTTTGWQVACDPIATSAQASAGTNNASIMTPLLVAQQTALRALLAGSATQVFNVGPAVSATQAPQLQQVQALIGASGGWLAYSASQTLTNAIANKVVQFTGSTTATFTLPAGNTMVGNSEVEFLNDGSAVLNIATASGDTMYGTGGVTSVAIQPGARFRLLTRGATDWHMLDSSGAIQFNPLVVAAATASNHALQLGQATGRLLAVTPFTASGTWTPNALTKSWRLRMVGAGGGSGGTGATSSTQSSISHAASAGSFCEAWFTTVPTSAAIVIGAAGAAGSNAPGNGGAGGNSTLTATGISVTCPGGVGGLSGGPYGSVQVNIGAVGPAACTITGAAQIVQSVTGQAGGPSSVISNTASMVAPGAGGSSGMGLGGTIGVPSGYGAGAAACATGVSTAAQAGYAGSQGYAVIEEYA